MANTAGQQRAMPGNKFPVAAYIMITQRIIRSSWKRFVKAVLKLYMHNKLLFTMREAEELIRGRYMMITFFMPLGAIFASSFFSRYVIMIIATIFYATGQYVLFIGSMPARRKKFFLYINWIVGSIGAFISAGAFDALGGDQFKLPEQQNQLLKYYGIIYLVHNISFLISHFTAPLLKTYVTCFGEQDCYSISIGIAAVLCSVELIVYLVSVKYFVKNRPPYGIMINFCGCICYGLKQWVRERKINPRPNWLDHAEPQYGAQLVDDMKKFFQMLPLLAIFPIFYAVYNQTFSKWVYQAGCMDGRISGTSFTILPDHYKLLNPFLILVFVPLVTKVFDPITYRWGFNRVLRRTIFGMGLIALSFVMAGCLESYMKQTYPERVQINESELRIFNGLNCSYTIQATDIGTIEMYPLGVFTKKRIPARDKKLTQLSSSDDCATFSENINLVGGKAISVSVLQNKDGTISVMSYEEIVEKPRSGLPVVSVLGLNLSDSLTIVNSKKVCTKIQQDSNDKPRSKEVLPEIYSVTLNGKKITGRFAVHLGGVYVASIVSNNSILLHEVLEPNSVHILWITPQTIILTLGEIYSAIAIVTFLYVEAPMSLKQVVLAIRSFSDGLGEDLILMMTTFGNLERDHLFYLSAFMMALCMVILFFIALRFKSWDPSIKII